MNGKSFRFCVLESRIYIYTEFSPVHDEADSAKMQDRRKKETVCHVKDTEAHTGKFKRYTL